MNIDIYIPIFKYKRVGQIVLARIFGILVYKRVGPKVRVLGILVSRTKPKVITTSRVPFYPAGGGIDVDSAAAGVRRIMEQLKRR